MRETWRERERERGNFLGVCSSCLCMFFMSVNGEKPIPYFNLVFFFLFFFFFFFFFFLFREERGIKWV